MTGDTNPPSAEAVMALLGDWERAKVCDLAQKVIHRLSRLKAAHIFSEYNFTNVWGEYSHHVQTGAYDGFSELLDDMAEDACEMVAETVPPHEMQLFERLAEACGDVEGMAGITYLVELLKEDVASRASQRNLERYADDYKWFENR